MNNKQKKQEYLNELYKRNLAFDTDTPFGYLYFDKINMYNQCVFVITGCREEDCEKKVFIDGVFSKIGDYAFRNNKVIEEVTLGVGVSRIGIGAFEGCSSLKKVVCRNTLSTVDSFAFKDCISLQSVQLGNNVYEVRDYTFENCVSLKHINLGVNISKLGSGCFKDCVNLRKVVYYSKLWSLSTQTFENCKSLKEFRGIYIIKIGEECFKNSGIERFYGSHRLRDVGIAAFENCNDFKTFYLDNFKVPGGNFNILVSGCNSKFSDADWVALKDKTQTIIERKRIY